MTAEERCNFGLCDKKAKRRGNEGPEAGEAAVGKVRRPPGEKLRLSMGPHLLYLPGVLAGPWREGSLLHCRRRADAVTTSFVTGLRRGVRCDRWVAP